MNGVRIYYLPDDFQCHMPRELKRFEMCINAGWVGHSAYDVAINHAHLNPDYPIFYRIRQSLINNINVDRIVIVWGVSRDDTRDSNKLRRACQSVDTALRMYINALHQH